MGGAGTTARMLAALAVAAVVVSAPATARQGAAEPRDPTTRDVALGAWRGLPLAFVPNAGQLDRRVRFSAQAGNASVFLTRKSVVLALTKGGRGLAVRLAFLGASPEAMISGARRSPGRVNYLIGNNPSRWQTNLPTYGEVLYRGLWPGIDLAVGGDGGQLKYEFRLAPGADPDQIRLRYSGQERLSLDRDGALRVETALGILRDGGPVSYQPVAGRHAAVASRFALGDGGAYGFALGAYDRRYPLVIDPGLVYSTYLGGSRSDSGAAIAVDRAGRAYLAGSTRLDFPATAGAFDSKHNGFTDAFVTKLNVAGSRIVYSTYLGGGQGEGVDGIAIDRAGSVYVTGSTASHRFPRTFPTTAGAFDRSYNGGPGDAFVTKLNPSGSALAYSTYLGGSSHEMSAGIAVDGAGSAYLIGFTDSKNFPTTAGAFARSYNGGPGDAFVVKLNPRGSGLGYSTYLGGERFDSGSGIVVDEAGAAYVTGETSSDDFPTTADAFDRIHNGSSGGAPMADVFLSKLDATGSALAYSTYLGGSYYQRSGGIAVDRAGAAYVTGYTGSGNFPTTTGAFDPTYNHGIVGFVTKLNATGTTLVYSTYLGGPGELFAVAIKVDRFGNAYVTGKATSDDFPTTASAFDRSFNGGSSDAFVTKLNPSGSALAYSTYLGGRSGDEVSSIALDGAGNAYVTGRTGSASFPTTAGAFDKSYNRRSGGDVFVTKLDLDTKPVRCRVPRVVGMTLPKARRAIRARHCSVGRVRSERGGRVLIQRPRAGVVRERGLRVSLVVGPFRKFEAAAQIYVNPSHGLTQEVQEEFPGHTGVEYWRAHLAAWERFGPNYLRGVGKYVTSGGDLRLSRPGPARWALGVQPFLRNWFSQSGRIAFQSNRDGNAEIYVMDARGGDQRNVSRSRANDEHPAWSADGKWIAFDSDRDHNNEIYVMAADGNGSAT